jgi:hypothetical protein
MYILDIKNKKNFQGTIPNRNLFFRPAWPFTFVQNLVHLLKEEREYGTFGDILQNISPPFFSQDCFLAHLTQRVRWAIVTTERQSSVVRPSVNFSHFNQLLWSHWANLNQTLVEWSLDGPFPKLCPVIPTSNQDGHQAKNRKKGGMKF